MIEEIAKVRDALNAHEFDAIISSNRSVNSMTPERILSIMLLAGCSIVLLRAILKHYLKNEVD